MGRRERPAEARSPKAPPGAAAPARPASLTPPLLALALISLAVYVAAMTLFKMSNNDIWIHLKTGEYVLTHFWVPLKDPYSFIAADHDYVAHEWLAGVLFYLVYAAGGVTGLIFFKAFVLAAACAFLVDAARLLGSRMSVILPTFTCLLYIASARYLERPHIFSYLMAAIYLWLFFRYRERGRNRVWLYLIIPAHTIWANLHGGWVQGLALVATFALGESLAWARARWLGLEEKKAPSLGDVKLLAALVPACLAATLLNPYGYRLLLFPFELTGLELFMKTIYEWQPPYHPSYNSSSMFFFFLIHVGLLCGAFFLRHRDRTRSKSGGEAIGLANALMVLALVLTYLVLTIFWFQQPPLNWKLDTLKMILYLILGLFSLFTVLNLRSVDFTQAGIFALFFLLSLRHNRAVTDAAMGSFVVLAASLSGLFGATGTAAAAARTGPQRRQPAQRPGEEPSGEAPAGAAAAGPFWADGSSPAAVVAGAVLTLGVAAHASLIDYYYDFRGAARDKGFGIAANMPTCAVDFVERNGITGNAFVSYPFAAMLIHRMHPRVKVNMDSRNDVYGEELYREYMAALRSPESMRGYLERHPIDFFMLSFGDRVPAVFDYLDSTGQWAPVYYDHRGLIYVRRKPETEDLIRREELKVLRPPVIGPTPVTSDKAPLLLEEAERCIRNCPTSPFGYSYKAKVMRILGRHEEALAAYARMAETDPRSALPYVEMAQVYVAMKRIDDAVRMYEQALRLQPDLPAAKEGLRLLRGA